MKITDPALIRLVTARYHDMQGLTTIADAVFPMGMGLVFMFGMFSSELVDSEWPILVAVLPMAVWVWARFTWIRRRIDAFYTERCGRVASVIGIDRVLSFYQAVMVLPLLIQFGAPLWLRVAIVLPLLVVHPLWIVVRDSPYRRHWLVPALVGFIAALRLVDVRTSEQAYMWQMWVSMAGGLAIACAGALDHLVLVRALGGGSPDRVVEDVSA
jgi:hypothetical protein